MKTLKKIFHIIVLSLILYVPFSFAQAKKYTTNEIVAMVKQTNINIENVMIKNARDHQMLVASDLDNVITSDFFGVVIEPGGDMINKNQYIQMVNQNFTYGFSDVKRFITHIQIYGDVVVEQGLIVLYANGAPVIAFACMGTLLIQDDGTTKYNAGTAPMVQINTDLLNRISYYTANPSALYHVEVRYDKIK
ncbi:MAG: nuclear transport factor 2 family protein [Neisseriaceae bacterium]|jgi:hypothetical protein